MAETCTELLHVREGRVGNVAVGIGGTLVSPPLSVDQVKRYVEDVKRFPETNDLIDIFQNGVPVNSTVTNLDPTTAFQYGNHSGVREHMDLGWKKLFDDIRRNRVLVFSRDSASSIKDLRVAPLGAVVTHKAKNHPRLLL